MHARDFNRTHPPADARHAPVLVKLEETIKQMEALAAEQVTRVSRPFSNPNLQRSVEPLRLVASAGPCARKLVRNAFGQRPGVHGDGHHLLEPGHALIDAKRQGGPQESLAVGWEPAGLLWLGRHCRSPRSRLISVSASTSA